MDNLEKRFNDGVNFYWFGGVPEGWDKKKAWHDPYLAGWLLASHQDNGIYFFAEDEDEDLDRCSNQCLCED